NSELNVSRFTEMHAANTTIEARCLELEAELSNLRDKSHNDNQNELVNHFSNLEVLHLNLQLKYQNLKDTVGNNPPTPDKDTFDFDSVFAIGKMNNKEAHLNYLRHLKESVETICEIVEEAKVIRPLDSSIIFACRYTKHSQEFLEYAIGTCCSKHMTGDRSRLMNFVKKFIRTVRFGNDHFCAIMGYGDYVIGDSVISRVYYVEELGHNLYSIRQFCDSGLKVAFRKHSCYVRDTDGVELIKGSRCSNLYTFSVEDMMKSFPICLLSKASKNKSWLWHRRLNHLNFGTINDLARKDLVRGLPRLKIEKDHLCSACQLGKSKKHTHIPKTKNTNLEVLNTLHMDSCGPMRVSKDETPEVVIKFLQQIQVGLNKTVRYIRTDNGTEFVHKALTEYYERIDIFHQNTVSRTPQQNGVVERRNRTLVEAARTMLIFSKTPIEDLGKLQPTADIGIFVGYAPSRKGYRTYNKRTRRIMETIHISSGLVPNLVPAAPYVPPKNKDLEILFQPMFDEYLEPPRVEIPVSPAPVVQAPVNSPGTPSSITIYQDAPSLSISPSSLALQSYSLHQGVAAESTLMEDNLVALVDNHPFINVFAPEPSSSASSSGDVNST
nr:retrovirus-related Pol polyprotein from transposon TNT 1-94 [Tanacetum cinerariifolium]